MFFAALASALSVWRQARSSLDRAVGWRYLDGVVSETLRLYPPGVISVRTVVEPFTFAGVQVPAGSQLVFSPYLTHRLPELWPQPTRFDPTRWDPDRPGYSKPAPHEYLPFGGGPHRCLGSHLARAELMIGLTEWHRRIPNYRLASDVPILEHGGQGSDARNRFARLGFPDRFALLAFLRSL